MPPVADPRYPVGKFTPPATITIADRKSAINALEKMPEYLRSALRDLDTIQLNTPYREGGWSIRQVVHHVADSHANAYVRFRLALTEEWPTIKPYEEAAWAELADARSLPVGVSLDLLTALHARWVSLLESLTEEDFLKGYVHPAAGGRQNLAQVLALYDWHSRHHTAHITNLRKRMGW